VTLARRVGAKGIVSVLEGGYAPDGLEEGLREHLAVLAEFAR